VLQPSDLLLYRSEYIATDSPRTNGGYLGPLICRTDVRNEVFDDATDNDRLYGSVVYRKVFWKILGPIQETMVYMTCPSTGDDSVVMFPGTPGNLEYNLSGTERKYGSAALAGDVYSGQVSFYVNLESLDEDVFLTGDTIYITDGVHEELQDDIYVSKLSQGLHISLPQDRCIINSYLAKNTHISSVFRSGTVSYGHSVPELNSVSGYLDSEIVLDARGVVDERWTIRFLSPTSFVCSGARIGTVGYGELGALFSPVHDIDGGPPIYAPLQVPYFTIAATGLRGSWQSGETLVFMTTSPTIPIWFKRTIRTGALSGTSLFNHRITGVDPSTS
jgi:hypothetical protein